MYYIRLLKNPKLQQSTSIVSATLAITTDLGDSLYPYDIEIKATVIDGTPGLSQSRKCKGSGVPQPQVVGSATCTWRSGMRALSVQIQCKVATTNSQRRSDGTRAPRNNEGADEDPDDDNAIIEETSSHLILGLTPIENRTTQLALLQADSTKISETEDEDDAQTLLAMPLMVPVSMKVALERPATTKRRKLAPIFAERSFSFTPPARDEHLNESGRLGRPRDHRQCFESPIPLQILEETGDSIARHTWDSGICLVAYLDLILAASRTALIPKQSTLLKFNEWLIHHQSQDATPCNVLELGTGTGLVGIHLKHRLPHADILLTDLTDAQEIVQVNIDNFTRTHRLPTNSQDKKVRQTSDSLCFSALDWNDPMLPASHASRKFDLVIASDCIYNTDSIPLLVSTFSILAKQSPGALFLVATKRRHDSESLFFEMIANADFITCAHAIVYAPMTSEVVETKVIHEHDDCEKIQLFVFQHQGSKT